MQKKHKKMSFKINLKRKLNKLISNNRKWIIVFFFIAVASSIVSYNFEQLKKEYENGSRPQITAHERKPKQRVILSERSDRGLKVYSKDEIKKEVLRRFEENKINPMVADCVIWGESRWDDQAISKSREDFGLMQWHIQHIESGFITPSCAFDWQCALDKAIKLLKSKGEWCQEKTGKSCSWYSYRNNNCGRFGKTFNY